MKTNLKKLLVLPVAGLAVAGIASQFNASDAVAKVETSWGPQDRPTYTWEKPADHVTFNSITDNPNIGDERNFVRVRKVGDTGYNSDSVDLEVGEEYEVFVYYHNNASGSLNASGKGIAQNVYMRTEFPKVLNDGENGIVTGFISSSNATPTEIWDTAMLKAHGTVYLNYVVNSAVIHNGGSSDGVGISGDALLSSPGATLAYWNDLWGLVPGCNEYAGYVTYRIKVDQPDFAVDKKVALSDLPDDYKDEITVLPGDTLNFQIHYKNTGTLEQTGVTFHDMLPNGISYITGTTFARSTRHPEGSQSPEALFGDGLGVGAIIAGEEVWVTYQAKVSDSEEIFPCGETEVYNGAYVATHSGQNSDKTKIVVKRSCEPTPTPTPTPTPGNTPSSLPKTGPGEIAFAVAVLLVISGGAFYLYRSHRMLRKVSSAAGADGGKSDGNIVLDGIKNTPSQASDNNEDHTEKN